MNDSSKKLLVRAVAEFVALAMILIILRTMIYSKIDTMLIEELKGAVAQQSLSISQALNGRFQETLGELQTRAMLFRQGRLSAEESLDRATMGSNSGISRGILRQDGDLIAGYELPKDLLKYLDRAFAGERMVTYVHGRGLLFAVSFDYDDETCAYYEFLTDAAVKKIYRMSSFNGKSTLILQNTADNQILLSDGAYPQVARHEIEYFNNVLKNFESLPLTLGKSNALYDENVSPEINLGFFFFRAIISEQDNLYFTGYVEWDDIVGAIDYVYNMMSAIFWVLLVLAFLLTAFLFRTRQAKLLEHEKIIADSANKAKSDFLSNMSHEIRTPINAIIGMDEMILRESKEPATLEYAHNLQNAATNLLELINDILDFSKIEAGKMEIIPVEYSLSSLLNDLVNMIQSRATKKGLQFEVEAAGNIPSTLFGDEIRIKQVITNILTNAVKYTEKGSVTLRLNYIPIDSKNIYLCISVSDTGIGIKKEDIKKLYSAFERIEEERNRKIEGTGLGMNITNKLLTMMGANLIVDSVYGQGSNFSFQIVQQVLNPEPIGDFRETYRKSLSHHKEYRESFTAPDAKILVVDDTVMNLTVVKALLKQTKIQIDTVLSGKECLKKIQKNYYDIIFIDHMMPGMDGIETLKAMRVLDNNLNQETPVISLTANAISGAREKYLSAGFQDYLTKPINPAQLEKLIVKFLPPEKVLSAEEKVSEVIEENISAAKKVFTVAKEKVFETNLPEWLKNVEGLNLELGIEHCGTEDAYLDVLEVFANSISSASKEIQDYFESENWKDYTTKVHALKSTAKVIGAEELSARAKRQEDAGNSNYIEEIKQNHEIIMQLYLSYAEKLKPLIKIEDYDADKPMIDDAELAEAYESMKEISSAFDYDSMQFVFESLDAYKLPESEIEKYKKIKDATEKLEWEKVSELLNS